MKVDSKLPFEIIYTVVNDPRLGVLIEVYAVQLTSAGNLSFLHQKIHQNNAETYQSKLDDNDYEALAFLYECMPDNLVKKFSKEQRIRPREFYKKYMNKKLFTFFVRPFIEKKIAKALPLLTDKKWYYTVNDNPLGRELFFTEGNTSALFHLRKNEDNTHYFITLKHKEQRVIFSQNKSLLICSQPCYLLVSNCIYSLDEGIDGQKLRPFVKKKFISIPKSSEESYFRKFLIPLIEQHNVYAVGIDIITERHKASPLIKITQLMDGSIGVILFFSYGEFVFPYHSTKMVNVGLVKDGESYKFIRVKRSKQWEEIKKEVLIRLGLTYIKGSEYGITETTDPYAIFDWYNQERNELEKAGFMVEIIYDKKISTEQSSFEIDARDEQDWFDLKAVFKLGGFEIPFFKLRRYLMDEERFFPLPNGEKAIIPLKWITQFKGLAELSTSKEELIISKHHIGLIQDFLNPKSARLVFKRLNKLKPVQSNIKMPVGFIGELRDYQKAGYEWLHFLWSNRFGGCLADDMGLGKTVQTLAFLQWRVEQAGETKKELHQPNLFPQTGNGITHLLVLPNALVYNWIMESKKFTPGITIHKHIGVHRTKSKLTFSNYNLIITTYGTLRNDIELFREMQFDVVVLDESQFIKNPKAQISREVGKIKAKMRLTLTGTPIENTINDLWSQMHFVNHGLLGSFSFFQKNYVAPIEKNKDQATTDRLYSIINPFILRRTKDQVAKDLPPKTEQVVYCSMTTVQEELYEKTKADYRNMLYNSIQKIGLGKSKLHILSGLTKLRQIANHPILANEDYLGNSGKFETIKEMLRSGVDGGHKILVFSQFVKHLALVKLFLEDEGIKYNYIDGSMNSKRRSNEVDSFQTNGENMVFLISLKAGGYGLNLTAANYVYLLDPWWNPAAEQQAIDRTHRIGQTKNVFSYKFITQKTVEEKILTLQMHKKSLSDDLIKIDESVIKSLNMDSISDLFE